VYVPVEEVVRRVKGLGYQVYFADDSSTREIEGNVFPFICSFTDRLALIILLPACGVLTCLVQPAKKEEGNLRRFLLDKAGIDVQSNCILTDEVRNLE
jgi:hypothetical protein